MPLIKLTRGKFTKVDWEDFDRLNQYSWQLHMGNNGKEYVRGWVNGRMTYMHRCLLGVKKEEGIDHINGDALDNRKANLRLATHSQNLRNRKTNKNNKSGYKGVSERPDRGNFEVNIYLDGKNKFLGCFKNKEKAAIAYNVAAKKYYGDFARLNEVII